MAKVTLNQNLKAMWGRIDNLVFRRSRSGRTYLSAAPDMSRVKWSDSQQAHRQRFKEAVAYAKAAMADERVRARYEQASVIQGKRPFRLRRGGLRLLQGTGFEEGYVGTRHASSLLHNNYAIHICPNLTRKFTTAVPSV